MNDPTALLARAVRGDRAALRAVVDAWFPQIRRWALLACGEPVAAEDAVQESLVCLLRSIHTYDPARPFAPWLKVLVFNTARRDHARGRREELHEQAALGQEGEGLAPAPGRGMDLARASQRVREAFAHLSPRQREILDLVDLQGETPAEVARLLGLTAGAVRGQLFQARRAVRSVLTDAERDAILPLLREA
jgi:RNA polymerase sigma factor (sigma-70 family)